MISARDDTATEERVVPDAEDPGGPLRTADEETVIREIVTLLSAFKRYSPAQIATALQLRSEDVVAMRAEPDVQDAVDALRCVLPRPGDIDELLASDTERNIYWLRGLREGRVDGQQLGTDGKTLIARTRAATVLLDRQVAKKVEQSGKALRVIDITDIQLQRMRALLEGPAPEPMPSEARSLSDADADRG